MTESGGTEQSGPKQKPSARDVDKTRLDLTKAIESLMPPPPKSKRKEFDPPVLSILLAEFPPNIKPYFATCPEAMLGEHVDNLWRTAGNFGNGVPVELTDFICSAKVKVKVKVKQLIGVAVGIEVERQDGEYSLRGLPVEVQELFRLLTIYIYIKAFYRFLVWRERGAGAASKKQSQMSESPCLHAFKANNAVLSETLRRWESDRGWDIDWKRHFYAHPATPSLLLKIDSQQGVLAQAPKLAYYAALQRRIVWIQDVDQRQRNETEQSEAFQDSTERGLSDWQVAYQYPVNTEKHRDGTTVVHEVKKSSIRSTLRNIEPRDRKLKK